MKLDRSQLWFFFYQYVKEMMKLKMISHLESICLSSRVDGWFHRWYHVNGNFMVNNIIYIGFCRPFTFYTMAVYIEACVQSHFSGCCNYQVYSYKPVIWPLWVTGLKVNRILYIILQRKYKFITNQQLMCNHNHNTAVITSKQFAIAA